MFASQVYLLIFFGYSCKNVGVKLLKKSQSQKKCYKLLQIGHYKKIESVVQHLSITCGGLKSVCCSTHPSRPRTNTL